MNFKPLKSIYVAIPANAGMNLPKKLDFVTGRLSLWRPYYVQLSGVRRASGVNLTQKHDGFYHLGCLGENEYLVQGIVEEIFADSFWLMSTLPILVHEQAPRGATGGCGVTCIGRVSLDGGTLSKDPLAISARVESILECELDCLREGFLEYSEPKVEGRMRFDPDVLGMPPYLLELRLG